MCSSSIHQIFGKNHTASRCCETAKQREEIKGNGNLYRPGPWKKEDGLEETVQDFKATWRANKKSDCQGHVNLVPWWTEGCSGSMCPGPTGREDEIYSQGSRWCTGHRALPAPTEMHTAPTQPWPAWMAWCWSSSAADQDGSVCT